MPRTEFKNTSDELSGLEAQQAGVAAEILHTGKEMADKKAARDADEKACADALARLTIEAAPEARAGKVREELAGVQASWLKRPRSSLWPTVSAKKRRPRRKPWRS